MSIFVLLHIFFVLQKSSFHMQRVAEYFSGSLLPPPLPSSPLPSPTGLNALERQLDAFSSHIHKCPLTM